MEIANVIFHGWLWCRTSGDDALKDGKYIFKIQTATILTVVTGLITQNLPIMPYQMDFFLKVCLIKLQITIQNITGFCHCNTSIHESPIKSFESR